MLLKIVPNSALDLAPLNYGVPCQDGATSSGYLPNSAEDVFTRFAAHPPETYNTRRFLCVINAVPSAALPTSDSKTSQWMYDDHNACYAFTPAESDILIAALRTAVLKTTALAFHLPVLISPNPNSLLSKQHMRARNTS